MPSREALASLGKPLMELDFMEMERLRQPSVYVWTRGDDVLYVGMSFQGLVRPLAPSHEKLRDFQPGDQLRMWATGVPYELEAALIRQLRPTYNLEFPRCPGCGGRLFNRDRAAGRCLMCQRRALAAVRGDL
jgi:tRNA(Ile2) C34 agmatinyltransferase TiaS